MTALLMKIISTCLELHVSYESLVNYGFETTLSRSNTSLASHTTIAFVYAAVGCYEFPFGCWLAVCVGETKFVFRFVY